MVVRSFARDGDAFVPLEVELTLLPGLPHMQITGLPDQQIRECQHRVKSAIKNSGFTWPRAQQILVNLKPTHIKKKSKGLDLAIAYAFLLESEQIKPSRLLDPVVYGGLGLDGRVYAPDDVVEMDGEEFPGDFLTGPLDQALERSAYCLSRMSQLSSEAEISALEGRGRSGDLQRPPFPDLKFKEHHAEWLCLLAVGGHSALVVGPAGSGKTTFAESLYYLLPDIEPSELQTMRRVARVFGRSPWRPLVKPHHLIPAHSLLGGGVPLRPGEITRAHGGLLVLDEFLEFHPLVKESLREPLAQGQITLARRGEVKVFPARFQFVATSNLCPCGSWMPGKPVKCQLSIRKCRSHVERITGPLVDRFHTLLSLETVKGPEVGLSEIFRRVEEARGFRRRLWGPGPPQDETLLGQIAKFNRERFLPEGKSRRRVHAVLQVARSFADMECSEEIKRPHLMKAFEIAVHPMERFWNF